MQTTPDLLTTPDLRTGAADWLQRPSAGDPIAREAAFTTLLHQLRTHLAAYEQRLLTLRQAHSAESGGCSSSACYSRRGKAAASWWQHTAFDGQSCMADPAQAMSNSAASQRLKNAPSRKASRSASRKGGKGSKQRPSSGQEGAAAVVAQPQGVTTAELLTRLLAASTPSQLAAQLARQGQAASAKALVLLCSMEHGAEAAAAFLGCSPPLLATRYGVMPRGAGMPELQPPATRKATFARCYSS